MNTIIRILFIAFLLTFTLAACKKSEAGPKGDTGAAGANGVANISVSVYTVSASGWTSYNWPYNYYETILNIPAVTNTVVTGGDVRVYILDATGTQWIAMPYSFFSSQYNYKVKAGEVAIQYTLYNNTTPTNPGTQQFKVVIIPPAS